MLTEEQIIDSKTHINNINEIYEQNQNHLNSFQDFYSPDDTLHIFLMKKMQDVQKIANIAKFVLEYVNKVQDQNIDLQKIITEMKKDINNLSLINSNLQNQIEDLCDQLNQRQLEIHQVSKKQQQLQLQKSMLRKQFQRQSSKITQKSDQNDINILNQKQQNVDTYDSNNLQNKLKEKDKENNISNISIIQQNNIEYKNCNQSLRNIRSKINQLKQTTNILREKVSDQDKISKSSIKTLKSQNIFLNKLPSLKSKYSQQSVINLSFRRKVDQNVENRWGIYNNLGQQLKKCQSTQYIQPMKNQNILQDIQQDKIIIIDQKTQSQFSIGYNQILRVSNNGVACQDLFKSFQPQSRKKIIKQLNKQHIKQQKKKEQKKETRIGNTPVNILWKIHDYAFNKIVKDRIQPRSSIKRFKRQQQQKIAKILLKK